MKKLQGALRANWAQPARDHLFFRGVRRLGVVQSPLRLQGLPPTAVCRKTGAHIYAGKKRVSVEESFCVRIQRREKS